MMCPEELSLSVFLCQIGLVTDRSDLSYENEFVHDLVDQVFQKSITNNPQKNLTGRLTYRDGYFLACIEGPFSTVNTLLDRIQDDPRQTHFELVHRSPVSVRIFCDWECRALSREGLDESLNRIQELTFSPLSNRTHLMELLETFSYDHRDTAAVVGPRD